MKEKTFKLVSKFFITLALIYWGAILLSVLTGCKTMQSSVINLKEPISTGGSWIMERKDFKASERNSLDDIDERLRALKKESKKYKHPNETTISLDPMNRSQWHEREDFLRHFD